MIIVNNVCKRFRNETVLHNVNLKFIEGNIYGFVGRNGSGKTVLIKIICGFLSPDEGTVEIDNKVLGKDLSLIENVGVIIETPGFLPNYSGFDNLKYLADLNKKADRETICKAMRQVGLDPYNKKTIRKYSLGMKQRLGIAQAIMDDPSIIILDEPMNSMDEKGMKETRELIKSLKNDNRIIIIASHIREDIDELCDEVYKFENGNVVKQ